MGAEISKKQISKEKVLLIREYLDMEWVAKILKNGK
jgi:hypothetical protein